MVLHLNSKKHATNLVHSGLPSESSQIINTVANVSSASNAEDEEEETDEWFEEEENLSCDPGAGIMNMLSKFPA